MEAAAVQQRATPRQLAAAPGSPQASLRASNGSVSYQHQEHAFACLQAQTRVRSASSRFHTQPPSSLIAVVERGRMRWSILRRVGGLPRGGPLLGGGGAASRHNGHGACRGPRRRQRRRLRDGRRGSILARALALAAAGEHARHRHAARQRHAAAPARGAECRHSGGAACGAAARIQRRHLLHLLGRLHARGPGGAHHLRVGVGTGAGGHGCVPRQRVPRHCVGCMSACAVRLWRLHYSLRPLFLQSPCVQASFPFAGAQRVSGRQQRFAAWLGFGRCVLWLPGSLAALATVDPCHPFQCVMQWAQRSRECPLCFRSLELEVRARRQRRTHLRLWLRSSRDSLPSPVTCRPPGRRVSTLIAMPAHACPQQSHHCASPSPHRPRVLRMRT